MKERIIIIAAILSLLVIMPFAAADIVVFDQYDTTMHYNDGKLTVTKQLRLLNTGGDPIIPGEIHFKISKDEKGKSVAPDITNFKVTNKFDKALDTRTIASDSEVDLVFTIWDPLLPDFFYDMTMTYELEFKPKGLLFYQIVLPEEKTTIPIKDSSTVFSLPKKYHITYSPEGSFASEDDANTVTWEEKGTYSVEYSLIPMPRLGIKAMNIFWIVIILIFLVNLILRLRKKAMNARSL